MPLRFRKPILYLITQGGGSLSTTPSSPEFKSILTQISAAVAAGIELIQIREKQLSARVLFELTAQAAKLTRGSATRLLVNDRADVAVAAGADGVHLTSQSINAGTIRRTFGEDFLIGLSTHSLTEARAAREDSADFVVFGPVFATASKETFGPPVGIEELERVASLLQPFPILALGGINSENVAECLRAGASGVAGISMFSQMGELQQLTREIREKANEQ